MNIDLTSGNREWAELGGLGVLVVEVEVEIFAHTKVVDGKGSELFLLPTVGCRYVPGGERTGQVGLVRRLRQKV